MNTNTKFPIFIIIASILTMAIFSSITNFGSASTTECFGSAKDPARFCAITYSIKEGDYIDATAYVLCTTDKDGHENDILSLSAVNVMGFHRYMDE